MELKSNFQNNVMQKIGKGLNYENGRTKRKNLQIKTKIV